MECAVASAKVTGLVVGTAAVLPLVTVVFLNLWWDRHVEQVRWGIYEEQVAGAAAARASLRVTFQRGVKNPRLRWLDGGKNCLARRWPQTRTANADGTVTTISKRWPSGTLLSCSDFFFPSGEADFHNNSEQYCKPALGGAIKFGGGHLYVAAVSELDGAPELDALRLTPADLARIDQENTPQREYFATDFADCARKVFDIEPAGAIECNGFTIRQYEAGRRKLEGRCSQIPVPLK